MKSFKCTCSVCTVYVCVHTTSDWLAIHLVPPTEVVFFMSLGFVNRLSFSQSHAQPDIDHTLLSEKYPRYPSVFNVTVTEEEKSMLMVYEYFITQHDCQCMYRQKLLF